MNANSLNVCAFRSNRNKLDYCAHDNDFDFLRFRLGDL